MVQEHLHLSRALLDRDLFHGILEAISSHSPQKNWRLVAARIGEHCFSTGDEQLRYQVGKGHGVLAFVEHVRGEDEVERSQTFDVGGAPVEEGRIGFAAQVGGGVVDGEIQRGLVVVRGEYRGAAGEGDDGRQPDAASELDSADTSEVPCREAAGLGEGAGPQFRPVGQPLVAVEVFLVYQLVRRNGMREAVLDMAYLDGRCGQARAAAKVGS